MVIIIMSNGNKLVYKLLQTSNVVLSTDFFAKILIPGNIGNHLCYAFRLRITTDCLKVDSPMLASAIDNKSRV